MNKRGQITVFIIVGILILGIIGGFLYLKDKAAKKGIEETEGVLEVESIKMHVERCLEKSLIKGTKDILSKGGHYNFPSDLETWESTEESTEEETTELPYYFKRDKTFLPSAGDMEKELSKAAEYFFIECIGNFTIFNNSGYEIKAEDKPAINATFRKETIVSDLIYPLEIKKGEIKKDLKVFSGKIIFSFPEKYQIIKDYLIKQKEEPGYFLSGELSSLAYKNGFKWNFKQYGEEGEEIVVSFIFEEPELKETFFYNFVLNYDWSLQTVETNEPETPSLILKGINEWNITKSGIFTYQINAQGEGLNYSIDHNVLEINPKTGLVKLNTRDWENDEYVFYLTVTDYYNNSVDTPLFVNLNANDGKKPAIKPLGLLTARIGRPFYYKIEADSLLRNISFAADSYLFEINKTTGEIRFTPALDDQGLHFIRVDAENEYGGTWELFELEIK